MSYHRVIPRDLFNEAKLLKCLGQLALILHDHEGQYNVGLVHRSPDKGFVIKQQESDGNLYCSNLHLLYGGGLGQPIYLSTVYNSKAPYPLYWEMVRGDEDFNGEVFNDDGSFATEFLNLIKKG